VTTLGLEPLRRLGDLLPRERQQDHQRQGADPEQPAPADDRQRHQGDDRGQDAAGRDAGVDEGVEEVLLVDRRELGDDRAQGGQQRAQPDPRQEPHGAEVGEVHGNGGEGHADGEPRDGPEDDLAAADVVADGAGRERADHDADQGVGAYGAGLGRVQAAELAGVLEQPGHDRAVDDDVVAVEDQGGAGQREDPVGLGHLLDGPGRRGPRQVRVLQEVVSSLCGLCGLC